MQLIVALIVVLLFGIIPEPLLAAAPPLLLGDAPSYPLAGHLEQLVDPGGQLTLADVLSPSVAARFTPIPGNMSRGYTGDAVWLRFRLERTAAFPEQAYLCLEPPYLNTIEVYAHAGGNPNDPAAYRQTLAGDHVPLSDRAIRTTGYAIPIVLPAGQPCLFLIRVRSTSSVALVGSVQTTTALVSAINRNVLFDSGYLAVALIIALINLIYFLRLRDRLFLFFALHILSLFFNQIALSGILNVLLPRQAYLLSDYLTGGGFGLGSSFFALIALSLFRHTAGGFSRALFWGIFALGLLTALAAPLDLYRTVAPLLVIAMFVLIMVLFRLGLGAVRRNEPGGRLYLAAFGLSNLGYAVQFLRLLGLLPTEWWSLHALQLTTFCNMVLMTLALTERVHAAEEQALRAAREAEQRAAVLAEGMTVELRQQKGKLEETLERQIRFVDMVSHEYRTPLAIIKTNLDTLRDLRESADREHCMNLMQRAVARLVEVVETSLGVSRLASPEAVPGPFERIEAADIIAEVRDEARTLWDGAVLNLPPPSVNLIFVLADRPQLKTALFNLIDNAVKYGGAGPIGIDLESTDRQVVISVSDQGPGVPRDGQESLKRKFHRGSSGPERSGEGIGLYLVDRIAEAHGGRLELRPNTPTGTVASLILPRCD